MGMWICEIQAAICVQARVLTVKDKPWGGRTQRQQATGSGSTDNSKGKSDSPGRLEFSLSLCNTLPPNCVSSHDFVGQECRQGSAGQFSCLILG